MEITQKNKEIIEEQDRLLTDIHKGVKNLNNMATTINTELKEQDDIIIEIDSKADNLNPKITRNTSKIDKLIKSAGGNGTFCLIIFLIVIVVILFYAIIYL